MIVFSFTIDDRPLVLKQLKRLRVLEMMLFIILPGTHILKGIQYLRMIKLLGDDVGIVRVDLHFPLAK